MSLDRATDFADRVKKFFYHRAHLAEQMCDETSADCKNSLKIGIEARALAPNDYEPLNNLYYDSRIIALIAIEGLAAHWETVDIIPRGGNYSGRYQARFSDFLVHLGFDDRLPRVCTPVLTYTLEQRGLEDHFRQTVYDRWVRQADDHIMHSVRTDPSIVDLEALYGQCKGEQRQPPQKTIKAKDGRILSVLQKFQYSALIYKYFRNSLVHEYGPSEFTAGFARGSELMVHNFTGLTIAIVNQSGEVEAKVQERAGGPIPQLDIGLGVLTNAVRVGADFLHHLIIANGIEELPHSGLLIDVKPEAKA